MARAIWDWGKPCRYRPVWNINSASLLDKISFQQRDPPKGLEKNEVRKSLCVPKYFSWKHHGSIMASLLKASQNSVCEHLFDGRIDLYIEFRVYGPRSEASGSRSISPLILWKLTRGLFPSSNMTASFERPLTQAIMSWLTLAATRPIHSAPDRRTVGTVNQIAMLCE